MPKQYYALMIKESNNLIGFTINECSGLYGHSCILDKNSSDIWVTTSRSVAEFICSNHFSWHTSSIENPENPFVGELVVKELTIGDVS